MAYITSFGKFRVAAALVSAIAMAACSGGSDSKPASETPASAPAPAQSSAPAQPVDRGATLFKKCRTCHTLGQGEPHRVGPNLHGLFGSKAATKEGFAYSKAMIASEIVWTEETLDPYIENPMKSLPGGKMVFAGMRKAEDRDALIEYLKKETAPADQ